MRALVYTGPNAVEMRDVPDPQAGPGEVVVRVACVGICGSDMHGFHGTDPRRVPPLILGHEAAGQIEGGDRDGARVAINPLIHCGQCPSCRAGREHLCAARQLLSIPPREGAFADRVVVPDANALPIPDAMPFETAALAEPLAVCWHAVKLGLRVLGQMPDRAVVQGGGAIGLGSALALHAHGVDDITIVEPNAARRAFLDGLGQTTAEALPPEPVDLVIDAVGYPATREAASAVVRPGGVIVHLGLGAGEGGFDTRRATLQEIAFVGSYCYTPDDFAETLSAMAQGRLGPLDWADHRPLDEGPQAFADLDAGHVAAPKIILSPET